MRWCCYHLYFADEEMEAIVTPFPLLQSTHFSWGAVCPTVPQWCWDVSLGSSSGQDGWREEEGWDEEGRGGEERKDTEKDTGC